MNFAATTPPLVSHAHIEVGSKKGTVAIERNNCRRRHWFARFKRKSIAVSKSAHMLDLTPFLPGFTSMRIEKLLNHSFVKTLKP